MSNKIHIDTWQKFAEALILTGELDPTYQMFYRARTVKGEDWTSRCVMHMLTFYDLGGAVSAANATTQDSFWDYVKEHYSSFPRGVNRRHSRGALGMSYVTNTAQRGNPETILKKMYAPTYPLLVKQMGEEFKGCGFGPYFIWKIMDLQDRVFGREVKIGAAEAMKYLPDEAVKGAKLAFPRNPVDVTLFVLSEYVNKYWAPGEQNRGCSYPEAETILCALRGHVNNTYTFGSDIGLRHSQLYRWPELQALLPPKQDWSQYDCSRSLVSA